MRFASFRLCSSDLIYGQSFAFQRKAAQGLKTPKHEIELVTDRLKKLAAAVAVNGAKVALQSVADEQAGAGSLESVPRLMGQSVASYTSKRVVHYTLRRRPPCRPI